MGDSNIILCPECEYLIGYNSHFKGYFCNKCGYLGDGTPLNSKSKNKLNLVVSSKCDISFEREVNECLWYYTMIHKSKFENILGLNGNDYENDVFMVRSYNWNEYDKDGKDLNEYHFYHKPSGFKLQWYKYPMRSPYVNMNITHEQFLDILRDCTNSIHPNCTYGITRWWKNEVKGDNKDE